MKESYTHISVVLDRSGSMQSIVDDTIGGFNVFLNQQREAPGEATLTLAQFDHEFEYIYKTCDVKICSDLTSDVYQPRGTTALLDAIGRVISDTGNALRMKPEHDRPEQVILVIITDGHENASREFSKAKINELIKHQEDKYNWEIIYLGANQDAITEGGSMGFNLGKSMTFDASPVGVAHAYASVAKNTTLYRTKCSTSMSFNAEDREAQDELLKGVV